MKRLLIRDLSVLFLLSKLQRSWWVVLKLGSRFGLYLSPSRLFLVKNGDTDSLMMIMIRGCCRCQDLLDAFELGGWSVFF